MEKEPPQITKSYITEENQWFTNGWKYENGEVYSFTDDRKEQNTQEGHHYTAKELFNDPNVDIEIKKWLEEILGCSYDMETDEDPPYKN